LDEFMVLLFAIAILAVAAPCAVVSVLVYAALLHHGDRPVDFGCGY
jgi:hypothetical protein